MNLFDFVYDWLIHLLPEKVQWVLIGLLVLGVAALFGIGWYLSR